MIPLCLLLNYICVPTAIWYYTRDETVMLPFAEPFMDPDSSHSFHPTADSIVKGVAKSTNFPAYWQLPFILDIWDFSATENNGELFTAFIHKFQKSGKELIIYD